MAPAAFISVRQLTWPGRNPTATNFWMLDLPEPYTTSSPAIAPDGTIYQATF